jgi:NAD(P)H-hydrate epimerase
MYAAACLGIYIHGKASEIAAVKTSEYSLLASELADFIGNAIAYYAGEKICD